VTVDIVRPGQPLPGDAHLVLLSGSKSTIADLAELRANGWDIDLAAHVRRDGRVLGICGGYQMLGRRISDPDGIEGAPGTVEGLGMLDVETVMRPQKRLVLTDAHHIASGAPVSGY
jgi:adenosylcobyric acid synthase